MVSSLEVPSAKQAMRTGIEILGHAARQAAELGKAAEAVSAVASWLRAISDYHEADAKGEFDEKDDADTPQPDRNETPNAPDTP